MHTPVPVFDGHNDTLLRLIADNLEGDNFFESPHGHIDLSRARRGGLQGGFFAVYIPSDPTKAVVTDRDNLPPALDYHYSLDMAMKMTAKLFEIERESHGDFRVARTVGDILKARADGAMSGILHFEGAEAIDAKLANLEVFYQAGLRSIGPVWSRPTIFAEGVPFRHHHSPDTGPGLTDIGKELIKACNQLRIMVDLSHMNEKGFWDVAKVSKAPLVATHSNVWNLSQTTRNLTDKQLDAIKDSDGMVGLNFAVVFLREDGAHTAPRFHKALQMQRDYPYSLMHCGNAASQRATSTKFVMTTGCACSSSPGESNTSQTPPALHGAGGVFVLDD
jgi:membrane dipeptidase